MKNSFTSKLFLYFINAVISSVLGIIFIKVCGLFIEPKDYGIYSVSLGIYSLISQIIIIVFSQSLLRFYSEYNSNEQKKIFYQTYLQLYLIISLFLILMGVLILPIIFNFIDNSIYKNLIVLFLIFFVFEFFYSITTSIVRCKGDAKKELISKIINHLGRIVFFLLYFFLISKTIDSILVASIGGTILGIIIIFNSWKVNINIFNKPDFALIKKIILYGLPLIGLPLINYFLSTSDHLIIKLICGDEDTGIYSMGYKISSNIFTLISSFIMVGAHPVIMRKYDTESIDDVSKFIKQVSLLYFIICLPALLFVLFYNNYIIKILASDTYLDSSFSLSIVSIGVILLGYCNFANKPWEMTKQSWRIVVYSLVGAIINIVLNLIFIPKFGFNAAAVTTVISYGVIIVLSLFASRKIVNMNLGFKNVIKLFLCNFILAVFFYLAKIFIVKNILSLLIVFIIGIIIYIFSLILILKKELVLIWNDMKGC